MKVILGDTGILNYPKGILVVSGNLEIVACNFLAARILGLPADSLVGRNLREFPLYEHLKLFFQGEKDVSGEIKLNGKELRAEINVLNGNAGSFSGYAVTFTDMAGAGRFEEVVREQERLAVVGRMAAGIVHELRNPMTAVRGFAQLLKEKKGGEAQPYVDYIIEEIDSCSRIIGNFLKLARPNPLHPRNGQVNRLVEEIAAMTEPRAFLQHVKVETDLAERMPDCFFDAAQMKQVLLNLVDNALEAMKEGGVLQFKTRRFDSLFAEITVRDTGCGIPEADLKKIGLPFFSTRENGTGLGLFICQAIVQAHKGRIEIESEEGKGAAFRIYLPFVAETGGKEIF